MTEVKEEFAGYYAEIDGVKYSIVKRHWVDNVDLRHLKAKQLVRWGDGKTYHELLTPIKEMG